MTLKRYKVQIQYVLFLFGFIKPAIIEESHSRQKLPLGKLLYGCSSETLVILRFNHLSEENAICYCETLKVTSGEAQTKYLRSFQYEPGAHTVEKKAALRH